MMLIKQGQMGVIKATCLGFLVVLLFESFAVSLGYTKEEEGEGALLDQLVDPTTGKIDDHLAELLWTNCRQDLNDLKGAFEDPELRLSEETQSTTNDIDPKGDSLTKESFQKLINVLHPQLKRVLSDCIKKKNLLSQDTGQDSGFKTCYPPNSVSLFRWCEVPRRSLATESIAVDSASNLGPPSPRSPPPASSLAYESTGSRSDPSLSLAFSTSPATINNFNRAVRKLEGNPDEAHEGHHTAEEDAEHMKLVIIACVATAVVTSLVAVLVLVLCFRRNSGAAVNDESPLLRLKSEDSGGSSQAANDSNPNKNVSSNGNDDIESDALKISLDGESSQGDVAAGAAQASSESSETPGNAGSQLPLPPGRAGTSPGGMPPLKPPPGREDLKPEAPAPAKSGPPPPPPPSNAGPRPPGPPPPPGPPGAKPGPPPPPPPKGGAPPPPPPKAGGPPKPPPSLGSKAPKAPNAIGRGPVDSGKAKLKPFFWDKVSATPEQGQVWNQIKAGSFQFNEEKIESLFGYLPEKSKSERKAQSTSQEPQFIQLLDQKKARNLSILLKALNVTSEEVSDALTEGNELPTELLQTLLKMAPTSEEELKLRLYTGEISQLGPAERFLKVLVDIPHAFQKMETLQFMCSLHEELTATRESFETLEEACKVLKSSRLFLKLLEAVLKTGNRMNDGTFRGGAMAFKLDTLLKLADVKGVDGKTTLLHFVVLEIIRSEGLRAARVARESKSFNSIKSEDLVDDVSPDAEEHYRSLGLQAVSNLSNDLEYVKKAAALDAEGLTGTVAKLGHAMVKTRNFLNTEMKESEEKSGFHETLKDFVQNAEPDVMSLLQEEKKIMDLVKSTGDYFHGNVKKDEGLRLFTVVRDFLKILDKVCIEVKTMKPPELPKKQVSDASSSSESRAASPSTDPHQKPSQKRADDSGSDSTSVEKGRKPAEAPKEQVSNVSSSSESRVAPPSPDPREKLAHAISQQRADDSGSNSSSDEKSEKPAGAPKKQVSNASSSSESRVITDPREKLAHAISQQRVDDSGSDSSSDEKSEKPAGASKKQVSNASSSSESRVIPDPREKLAHAISQQRVDDFGSDSSSDEKSEKPAGAPKKQVSNASSSSESRVIPDPREKLAHAISQQRVDDFGSNSSSDEKSEKPAGAPKKQVSNASSSSESRVIPDPREKLAHAISQQRVDDFGSNSSSDEKSEKPAGAPKKQVSNASSSSESRVIPDPREKLAHAISQQRLVDSGSDSSSDEKTKKPAGAPKKQVSNASSSSESRVIPDPREKLAHAISQQRLVDSGSDSSSDEKTKKPAGAPKKQVSNASSSSESHVIPNPREKLAHSISQQRVDDSGSDSNSDEKSKKPAEAPKKQVSNASSSSESRVIPPSPDPREKLAHVISQQREDDSSFDSSSDENS